MNFLKKGPELKLPDKIKVPDFLLDLYYDLKDRHLLPLVGILLVALVAVPIALGSSGSEPEESPAPAAPSAVVPQGRALTPSGQLVASSAPGLRDYRRRLRHLEAKDPFAQQYSAPDPAETESSASSTTTTETESFEFESSESSETFTPSEPGSHTVPGKLHYYSYAIDVRLYPAAESQQAAAPAGTPKPVVRRNLPELTMLPSRKVPAIIYMGSTRDGKKALMLVSSAVDAIFGDGKCVLGSQTCELLAMEPGLPETFVYGAGAKTYKIELVKIGLVETDKLNKAPLGEPSPKQPAGRQARADTMFSQAAR